MDTEKLKDQLHKKIQKLIPRVTSDNYFGISGQKFFHYTTFDAFKNIIENNELHSTFITHLNDPTEVQHSYSLIKNAVAEYPNFDWFHKEKHENMGKRAWMIDLFKKLGDGFEIFPKQEIGDYIVSLSCVADEFNCWRFYGDKGKGVSLGFEINDENMEENKTDNGEYPKRIHLQKILYGKPEAERWIHSMFQQAFGLKTQMKATDIAEIMLKNLIFMLPSIKDSNYKIENEVRLLRYPLYNIIKNNFEDELDKSRLFSSNIKPLPDGIRLKHDRKVTWKYRLELDVRKHLKEIWIGPALDFKSTSKHFEKLLHDNTFLNVEIKESKHPIC